MKNYIYKTRIKSNRVPIAHHWNEDIQDTACQAISIGHMKMTHTGFSADLGGRRLCFYCASQRLFGHANNKGEAITTGISIPAPQPKSVFRISVQTIYRYIHEAMRRGEFNAAQEGFKMLAELGIPVKIVNNDTGELIDVPSDCLNSNNLNGTGEE